MQTHLRQNQEERLERAQQRRASIDRFLGAAPIGTAPRIEALRGRVEIR